MSFSFDLNTIVGQIRSLIGDTDATNYFLSDEEITVFYNTYLSLFRAAAFALRAIANKKMLNGKDVKAGNYAESSWQYIKMMRDAADEFEKLDNETPADAQAEVIYTDFDYRTLIRNKVLRGEPLDT